MTAGNLKLSWEEPSVANNIAELVAIAEPGQEWKPANYDYVSKQLGVYSNLYIVNPLKNHPLDFLNGAEEVTGASWNALSKPGDYAIAIVYPVNFPFTLVGNNIQASLLLGARAALSCLMVPVPVTKEIKALQNLIPDNVIYLPDDPEKGREEHPHITVVFGLVTENIEEIKEAVQNTDPIVISFDNKTSIFEPDPEYDVVKVDVRSSQLSKMNNKLQEHFEIQTDHPEYKPHLTIAYVKKGKGKDYEGLPVSIPSVKVNTLEFSNHDHNITSFDIIRKEASLSLSLAVQENASPQGYGGFLDPTGFFFSCANHQHNQLARMLVAKHPELYTKAIGEDPVDLLVNNGWCYIAGRIIVVGQWSEPWKSSVIEFLSKDADQNVSFKIFDSFTSNGRYIAFGTPYELLNGGLEKISSSHTDYLKEHGIETVDTGLGFSEKEQKWYGWSHRATHGFGIGDKVEEGDATASSGWTADYLIQHPEKDKSLSVGFEAKTLEDARKMAEAFAESVSSLKFVDLSLKAFSAKGDIIVNIPTPGGEGELKGKVLYRKDKKGQTTAYYYDAEGKLHREKEPAIVGSKETAYYIHGLLHNDNGPARILSNGMKEYWLYGKPLTKEEWEKQKDSKEQPVSLALEKEVLPSAPEKKQINISDLASQNTPGDIWEAHLLSGKPVYFTLETIEHMGEKEIIGYGKYSLYIDDIPSHSASKFTLHDYDGPFKKIKETDIMPESSLISLSLVDLPGGEVYDNSDLQDIQFDEKVKHSPTVRKEDQDIVKYRLDPQDEEKFFEKGLHQKVDMPQVTRSIVPYGSLQLIAWEEMLKVGDKVKILSKSVGSSVEEGYMKIGDIGTVTYVFLPETPMWRRMVDLRKQQLLNDVPIYSVITSGAGGGSFLASDLEVVEEAPLQANLKLSWEEPGLEVGDKVKILSKSYGDLTDAQDIGKVLSIEKIHPVGYFDILSNTMPIFSNINEPVYVVDQAFYLAKDLELIEKGQ
ncbi:MAG: 2'-5' RNA ligase family protein [Methanogenium sp.]|jgi:2'-5' RNA ligase